MSAADPAPRLVLFSGLPGCGKTTLARAAARRLSIPLLAKDRVQRVLRDQVADAPGVAGYHLLMDLAAEQLALGISVVLDAVFPLEPFRVTSYAIAAEHGARYRAICCYCSDEVTWRARLAARVQYVPGWTPVGWEEVERLRAIYVPWPPDAALSVDAMQPLDHNLTRVLSYLQS